MPWIGHSHGVDEEAELRGRPATTLKIYPALLLQQQHNLGPGFLLQVAGDSQGLSRCGWKA